MYIKKPQHKPRLRWSGALPQGPAVGGKLRGRRLDQGPLNLNQSCPLSFFTSGSGIRPLRLLLKRKASGPFGIFLEDKRAGGRAAEPPKVAFFCPVTS